MRSRWVRASNLCPELMHCIAGVVLLALRVFLKRATEHGYLGMRIPLCMSLALLPPSLFNMQLD